MMKQKENQNMVELTDKANPIKTRSRNFVDENGMKELYDCNGKLTCKVNKETGYLERKYKGANMNCFLEIGRTINIECQGARTIVRRSPNGGFAVLSEII